MISAANVESSIIKERTNVAVEKLEFLERKGWLYKRNKKNQLGGL